MPVRVQRRRSLVARLLALDLDYHIFSRDSDCLRTCSLTPHAAPAPSPPDAQPGRQRARGKKPGSTPWLLSAAPHAEDEHTSSREPSSAFSYLIKHHANLQAQ